MTGAVRTELMRMAQVVSAASAEPPDRDRRRRLVALEQAEDEKRRLDKMRNELKAAGTLGRNDMTVDVDDVLNGAELEKDARYAVWVERSNWYGVVGEYSGSAVPAVIERELRDRDGCYRVRVVPISRTALVDWFREEGEDD